MKLEGGSSDLRSLYYGSNSRDQLDKALESKQSYLNSHESNLVSLSNSLGKSLDSRQITSFNRKKNKKNSIMLKAKKVSAILNVGTAIYSKIAYFTFLGARVVKVLRGTSSSAANKGLGQSLNILGHFNFVGECISFIKSSGSVIKNSIIDVSFNRKRRKSRQLLSKFNADTRDIHCGESSKVNELRLKSLMSEKATDLSKSKSQITNNRIAQAARGSHQVLCLAYTGLSLAKESEVITKKILPGLGLAVAVVDTIKSVVNTASQIRALNNLAKARSASKDPLLMALSGHIKNERTLNARVHLVETVLNSASTSLNAALTFTGVGSSAGFVATGIFSAAFLVGNAAFKKWRDRKFKKKRDHADYLFKLGRSMDGLASKNIGVAEKIFLDRLQNGSGADLAEAVKFLRDFGIKDARIKKIQLEPEDVAIDDLRNALYHDKVSYKGVYLKQTIKNIFHVLGIGKLGGKIKAGTLWLRDKLSPIADGQKNRYFGASLQSNKALLLLNKRDVYQSMQITDNPFTAQQYVKSRHPSIITDEL